MESRSWLSSYLMHWLILLVLLIAICVQADPELDDPQPKRGNALLSRYGRALLSRYGKRSFNPPPYIDSDQLGGIDNGKFF